MFAAVLSDTSLALPTIWIGVPSTTRGCSRALDAHWSTASESLTTAHPRHEPLRGRVMALARCRQLISRGASTSNSVLRISVAKAHLPEAERFIEKKALSPVRTCIVSRRSSPAPSAGSRGELPLTDRVR
eukprot:7379760-Prymnesium_polylepis.1